MSLPAATAVTPAQIRALQAARRSLGMSDDDYRAWLGARAGVTSTKDLRAAQAARLIDELAIGRPKPARPSRRSPAATVSGPYAAKLRALWISGWHLGVVRERDDRALIAFVERQTGLSHTRFLADAGDATKAIEAIKAMLAREAGVVWPAGRHDVVGSKRAVLSAQLRRLGDGFSVHDVPEERLDTMIAEFGAVIRKLAARGGSA